MYNKNFNEPNISYSKILNVTNLLIEELNNGNFVPFDIDPTIGATTDLQRSGNIKKAKRHIQIRINQIQKYTIICKFYDQMDPRDQVESLKVAKRLLTTWKSLVTKGDFAPYQYMLWSMLNLPLKINSYTLNANKKIIQNVELKKYIKGYDEKTHTIIWHVPLKENIAHSFRTKLIHH